MSAGLFERYRSGETMADIARTRGVSRERIRQIIVAEVGQDAIDAVKAERQAARRERLDAEREASRAARLATCGVCGVDFVGFGQRAKYMPLCARHRGLRWPLLRLINERRYSSHRAAPSQRSRRQDPTLPPNRRFLVAGSAIECMVRDALDNDWPILACLPEWAVERVAQ